MSKASIARRLREKYGISIRELAGAAGVSLQYISDLELGKYAGLYEYRLSGAPLMQKAFEGVAAERAELAHRLSGDLGKYSSRLLDFVEDGNDEL